MARRERCWSTRSSFENDFRLPIDSNSYIPLFQVWAGFFPITREAIVSRPG